MAQPHVPTRRFDVNLGLGRRKFPPGWISTLRRDKGCQFRHGVEHANGSMRSEISCKKSEVKSFGRNGGKGAAQARFVRATPVAAVMQKRRRGMQLAQNPLVGASRDRLNRGSGQLQVS